MNWYLCKKYQIVYYSVWILWYNLYSLCRKTEMYTFVVFIVVCIEIIFSHGDVFDSNIKIFW